MSKFQEIKIIQYVDSHILGEFFKLDQPTSALPWEQLSGNRPKTVTGWHPHFEPSPLSKLQMAHSQALFPPIQVPLPPVPWG